MPKVKQKKTREEKLAQARRHKKEKYEELKKDPVKYAAEKEKERLRYLKRKQQKKIKTIHDMTPRQQRAQRKKWRDNAKKYNEKKKRSKQIQQMLIQNSPPTSDSEECNNTVDHVPAQEEDPLEGPSRKYEMEERKRQTRCTNCTQYERKIRRLRYLQQKRIGIMKAEMEKERNMRSALQKKIRRLTCQNQSNIPSTEEKVDSLITNLDEEKKNEVKKKLMFGEVLKKELSKGFKTLKKKEKREFSDVIVKDRERFKKIKSLNQIVPFTVRDKAKEEILTEKENMTEQEVVDFLEDDSNSKISADKKEYIKRNGLTKQKRYLSDTLINLHAKFVKTHNHVPYSTFCKYRPFWIVFPKDSDRNTCSCIVHLNMDLLIQALQRHKIIKETNGSSLLATLCCDIHNEKCLSRTCEDCSKKFIDYGEFRNDQPIKYHQWGSNMVKYYVKGEEKATKKTTKSALKDLPLTVLKKLEDALPRYFQHCLNIVHQYKNITELKKSLTPKEVLIHMDFSENYVTKFHEEVQSRHFGSSPEQITLHTSVIYLLDSETGLAKTYSMCTISDCCRHDAEAIWAHVIPIIEYVQEITNIDTIHFVTDSPSSQYRNRKIFFVISQLQQLFPDLNSVTWNYLESGHGKGAPDGIGAVIKRTADNAVRFGTDLGTLKDFWNILKTKIKNVELRLVTSADVESKTVPQKLNVFKGTMRVHQVLWSSNSLRMTFRKLSCFFCPNGDICNHGYHLGYMDIPEEQMDIQRQEEQLLEFLDTNTTPEIIEDITNPSSTTNIIQDIDFNVHQLDESTTVKKEKGKSPKVKILSDVRVSWENTTFYNKVPFTVNTKTDFQNDFERFINVTPTKSGVESCKSGPEKQIIFRKEEEKENESSDEDLYNIF